MLEKIKEIRAAMEKELRDAVSSEQLRELKVKYLGKKGSISEISKSMGKLQPEERPKAGQMVNELRQALEQNLARRQQELADKMLQAQLAKEKVDITLPGRPVKLGSKHPLTQVMDDFKEIFLGMGYAIAEGPQVEPNPVKVISPGTVYRRDDDATHSPMFHQVEGLVVDEGISLADLKGTLLNFVRQMFGEEREIRLRPSFFPFTEPTFPACFAAAAVAVPVRIRAGLKFWALAWCTPMF